MAEYAMKRLVLFVPTLIIVTFMLFTLIRILPGDVVAMMNEFRTTPEAVERTRQQLGLDKPMHEQYITWIGQVVQGNLGESVWSKRSAVAELRDRLPATLELAVMAMTVSLTIAFSVGIISALHQDTKIDYIARGFAIAALSIPNFWTATLIIVIPSILFHKSPPLSFTPFTEDPVKNLSQFILPAIVLGINTSGSLMRMTRAMMLEVLRQDYIRTAWAKGLRQRQVVVRHALRNAMIPVITIIGLQLPLYIGGTVIIESIFGIPGIGNLTLQSITTRDLPMVSALNLVFAVFILGTNLLVDMAYGYLDPRIRYR